MIATPSDAFSASSASAGAADYLRRHPAVESVIEAQQSDGVDLRFTIRRHVLSEAPPGRWPAHSKPADIEFRGDGEPSWDSWHLAPDIQSHVLTCDFPGEFPEFAKG